MEGTLQDFGISNVLQNLGNQKDSGTLYLQSGRKSAEVCFRKGNIIRATRTTGKNQELIGELLVRAQLLSPAQLAQAVLQQKKTLQRLGTVLVDSKALSPQKLRQMVQRQTLETLYDVLTWKTGTHRFDAHQVPVSPDESPPLRPQAILAEGVKRLNAWPEVRKVIYSYQMTFSKARPLPAESVPQDALDRALDKAMAEFEGRPYRAEGDLLAVERWVYSLVTPSRDTRALIDVSCMGEFEVCQALKNLVVRGYLKAYAPVGDAVGVGERASWLDGLSQGLALLWVSGLLVLAIGLTASLVDKNLLKKTHVGEPDIQRHLSLQQLARIRAALEVYRLETGDLPDSLNALSSKGLLTASDLSYPFENTYVFRKEASDAYVLLPPLR